MDFEKFMQDELIRKYFGCGDCHGPHNDHLVKLHTTLRILRAMFEPIKKGDRYLEYIYSSADAIIDEDHYEERICKGVSGTSALWQIEEFFDRFHPRELRLPQRFQPAEKKEWLDPTPEMLKDKTFEAIWQTIKTWDINVPHAYGGYCGATGNHVRAILDAIRQPPPSPKVYPVEERCHVCGGDLVLIRGRYPGNDKRTACPTCLTERMENIRDISDRSYGVPSQQSAPKGRTE